MKVFMVALFSIVSATASASTNITLVQSIPAETNLAQPNLPHAKDTWVKMIAGAKKSIDIGQFYLSNAPGSDLEPVIQELEKAGARGVIIRTIVDKGMQKNDPATYERFRKIPHSEMRIYDIKHLTGGIIHAKYFIIDQELVFIGSQNFDWKALSQIQETGVLVKDPDIATKLTQIFEIDWEICRTGKAPEQLSVEPVKPGLVELVAAPPQFNPPTVRSAIVALQELLRGAKKSIQIQVMSYSNKGTDSEWGEIQNELIAAARRGVKVQLTVSDWNNTKPNIDHVKELQKTAGITIKVVTIPPYSGGCITYARTMHTKMMVVDEEILWVGTSNWSRGYFYNTRGVEMIFRMPEIAKQGKAIIDTMWNSPYAALLQLNKNYIPPVRDCSAAQ